MNATYDSIVIGAGQAGLAAGYYLQRAGRVSRWLTQRRRSARSGGGGGTACGSLLPRATTVYRVCLSPASGTPCPARTESPDYLKAYTKQFDLPVRLGTRVTSLRPESGAYSAQHRRGEVLSARSVIAATGANQQPYVPAFAAALDPQILQFHSSDYRRPEQPPSGSVLMVGAGNSGAQIALELAEAGRKRRAIWGRTPGHCPAAFSDETSTIGCGRRSCAPSVDSHRASPDAGTTSSPATRSSGCPRKLLERADFERAGEPLACVEVCRFSKDGNVDAETVAVIWCTGFRPDFSWIELPVLGLDGYPLHRRGLVETAPGIAFLGMRFQYRVSSALLGGVGEDAAYVASETVRFLRSK